VCNPRPARLNGAAAGAIANAVESALTHTLPPLEVIVCETARQSDVRSRWNARDRIALLEHVAQTTALDKRKRAMRAGVRSRRFGRLGRFALARVGSCWGLRARGGGAGTRASRSAPRAQPAQTHGLVLARCALSSCLTGRWETRISRS
jgi:hypothetical protein